MLQCVVVIANVVVMIYYLYLPQRCTEHGETRKKRQLKKRAKGKKGI